MKTTLFQVEELEMLYANVDFVAGKNPGEVMCVQPRFEAAGLQVFRLNLDNSGFENLWNGHWILATSGTYTSYLLYKAVKQAVATVWP